MNVAMFAIVIAVVGCERRPTPREYAFHYPTCYSSEQRDYCFSKTLLPCTPNGWDDLGSMVCSKAKTLWRCPAVSFPFDDGNFESLRCWNMAFTYEDRRPAAQDWGCGLSLYTYMDPRKWATE